MFRVFDTESTTLFAADLHRKTVEISKLARDEAFSIDGLKI